MPLIYLLGKTLTRFLEGVLSSKAEPTLICLKAFMIRWRQECFELRIPQFKTLLQRQPNFYKQIWKLFSPTVAKTQVT